MWLLKIDNDDDAIHETKAEEGFSLMQVAVDNGIDGVMAESSGVFSCATCHCYIDEAWQSTTGKASEFEFEILDCVMNPQENSRLSCQVTVTEKMDGLVVRILKITILIKIHDTPTQDSKRIKT